MEPDWKKYWIKLNSYRRSLRLKGLPHTLNDLLCDISYRARLSWMLGEANEIIFEISTYCSCECIQCVRTQNYRDFVPFNKLLSFKNFRRILHQFRYPNLISFGGLGEPLSHPDVFPMMEYVKEYFPSAGLFLSTNAVPLINAKIREKLIQSNLDYLQISIDGCTHETFKKTRGFPFFREILGATKELLEKRDGMHVTLTLVLMEENFHEWVDFVDLAKSLGADRVQFVRLNFAAIRDKLVDQNFFRSEPYLRQIQLAQERAKLLDIESLYIGAGGICIFLWKPIYVNVEGYLAPCCAKPLPKLLQFGNLLEEGFKHNTKMQRELRKRILRGNPPRFCLNCSGAGYF